MSLNYWRTTFASGSLFFPVSGKNSKYRKIFTKTFAFEKFSENKIVSLNQKHGRTYGTSKNPPETKKFSALEKVNDAIELFHKNQPPMKTHALLRECFDSASLPESKLGEVCFYLGTLHEAHPDLLDQENLGADVPLPDPDAAKSVLREIRELRKEARRKRRAAQDIVTQVDGWRDQSQDELQVENDLAWEWYLKAAEKGHVESMVALGRLCLPEAASSFENARQLLRWYTEAATSSKLEMAPHEVASKTGCSSTAIQAEALYGLGIMHEQGLCGISDSRTAAEFYRLACHLKSPSALYYTGHNYLTGNPTLGIEKAPTFGVNLLQQAANKDHGGAQTYLALLYRSGFEEGGIEQDGAKFWEYLNKAEINEDDEALYLLGDISFHGSDGVEKDFQKAFRFFERSASQGHAEACYCLGVMYYHGYGTEQSYEDSFRYYQYAAEQNHMLAWRNIASMYMHGHGVPKSESTANHILKVLGEPILSQIEQKNTT
mmetsp:Transcript_15306/g.20196  ORF Transcript_15306/g.20196 Transcript_15306/m.20196 type:complete len:490 (+) Transcript_15306:22-1491(+)